MKFAAFKRFVPLLLITLMIVLLMQSSVLACPTCKDALAQNDPAAANLARGYFWSILFMMSMPFLILSCLSAYFYYEVLKARAAKATAEKAADAAEPAFAEELQNWPEFSEMGSFEKESACEELVEV